MVIMQCNNIPKRMNESVDRFVTLLPPSSHAHVESLELGRSLEVCIGTGRIEEPQQRFGIHSNHGLIKLSKAMRIPPRNELR